MPTGVIVQVRQHFLKGHRTDFEGLERSSFRELAGTATL